MKTVLNAVLKRAGAATRVLAALLILPALGFGQRPSAATAPGAQIGRTPSASYFNADIDRIGLYNGNLSLEIPLFNVPGRDVPGGIKLIYNAQKWDGRLGYPSFWMSEGRYMGGWRVDQPGGAVELYTEWLACAGGAGVWLFETVWQDGTGAKRLYRNAEATSATCGYEDYPADVLLYSVDGDGSVMKFAVVFIGEWYYIVCQVQLRDGTLISPVSIIAAAASMNGNITDYTLGASRWDVVAADSLGHSYGWYENGGTMGYLAWDANGNPQQYGVHLIYPSVFNPWVSPFTYQTETLEAGLLETLDLPNGQSYAFEYGHIQGFMTKVTLPGGGYIRYVYAGGNESTGPGQDYIVERYVSADGNSEHEQVWYYEWGPYDWNCPTCRTVTVWSPETGTSPPTAGPVVHVFNAWGLEEETSWHAPDGVTLLKDVWTTWIYDEIGENGQAFNPKPEHIYTISESGWIQDTAFTYTASGAVETKSESDWYMGGTAPPLRRTVHTHTTLMGLLQEYERPESVEIQGWNGSEYVTEGKTVFAYDQTELMARTGGPEWVTWDRGNVTAITRYRGPEDVVTETFAYDVFGNVVSHTDENEHTTTFSFDDNYRSGSYPYSPWTTFGFPTAVTDAASHTTVVEYDYSTGLPTTATDPRGRQTFYTYDAMNRPYTITEPSGRVTTYIYTDYARSVVEDVLAADGQHRVTETLFDGLNHPVFTTRYDPAGNIGAETEYDGNGRVKRVAAPRRGGDPDWTTTDYDALNRPVAITNPDATVRTFSYVDNTVTMTDEAGNQRRQTFNGIGQMIKVEEPHPTVEAPNPALDTDPLTTLYAYNASGALLAVCQYADPMTGECAGGAQTRSFAVNWLGQRMEETHPETGTTAYGYYANGLLYSKTDARSITTYWVYDAVNRVIQIVDTQSSADTGYAYDEGEGNAGLLTTIYDQAGTVSLGYNTAGRLVSETRQFTGAAWPLTTGYAYDYDGRVTQIAYPSGRVVTQTYAVDSGLTVDRLGALTMSTQASPEVTATLLSSIVDNAAGQVTERTLGDGVRDLRYFNVRNQLTDVVTLAANTDPLLTMNYDYGAGNNGNIQAQTFTAGANSAVMSYSYDGLQRLIGMGGWSTWQGYPWALGWQYDDYGNRLHQTAPEWAAELPNGTNRSFNANNQFDETGYGYDAAGNVTQSPMGAGSITLTWDAESRMTAVNTDEVRYVYDYAGRRVMRITAGETKYYVYGLTGLMSEFSTTDTGVTAAAANDQLTYVIPDHSGTGMLLVDAIGTVIETNLIFPFGELWTADPNPANDEKFTTYHRDPDTGFDYAMARWYASREGRFMSPDPGNVGADLSNPQSWNAYAYVGNDPVNFVDPTGRQRAVVRLPREFLTPPISQRKLEDDAIECKDGSLLWCLKLGLGIVANAIHKADPFGLAGIGNPMMAVESAELSLARVESLLARLTAIKITQQEANVIIGRFDALAGKAEFIAQVTMTEAGDLFLRGTHIEGAATLKEGLDVAKAMGREMGAKRVIIEGGKRTTGANPGHFPKPIILEIEK